MSELKKIEDAWLNLDDVNTDYLINPFDVVNFNEDDAHYRTLWLMTRPEYFSFLCKHVFNINILPSQALFSDRDWETTSNGLIR